MSIDFIGTNESMSMGFSLPQLRNVAGASGCAWVDLDAFPVAADPSGTIFEISVGPPGTPTLDVARFAISYRDIRAIRTATRALDADASSNDDTSAGSALAGLSHIASSIDYNTRVVKTYIKGVLVMTNIANNVTAGNTSNTLSKTGSIGSANDNLAEFINGRIEDLRIYSRVLSDNEVQTIFECQGVDGIVFGLESRWEMQSGPDGATVNQISASDSAQQQDDAFVFNGTPTYRPSIAPTFRRRLP